YGLGGSPPPQAIASSAGRLPLVLAVDSPVNCADALCFIRAAIGPKAAMIDTITNMILIFRRIQEDVHRLEMPQH
ncbi:MAG: hypothetical protein QGH20_02095, partial [Candidatus Latescibacteria bacterium]|nr:hypothetical protein [Candidatus Latescibacterota bacterium]